MIDNDVITLMAIFKLVILRKCLRTRRVELSAFYTRALLGLSLVLLLLPYNLALLFNLAKMY